jgi:hypothetical protein
MDNWFITLALLPLTYLGVGFKLAGTVFFVEALRACWRFPSFFQEPATPLRPFLKERFRFVLYWPREFRLYLVHLWTTDPL